jgi:hypothetical protein
LADHSYRDEFILAINAPMSIAAGSHDAALIPPLQLTRGDFGQCHHLIRCELSLHRKPVLFQTKESRNVSNILGGNRKNQANDSLSFVDYTDTSLK